MSLPCFRVGGSLKKTKGSLTSPLAALLTLSSSAMLASLVLHELARHTPITEFPLSRVLFCSECTLISFEFLLDYCLQDPPTSIN